MISKIKIMESDTHVLNTNRNKNIQCKVCGKVVRNDTLKRHLKIHNDLMSLPEEDLRIEIEQRKRVKNEREKQAQQIRKIALEVGASPVVYEQSIPEEYHTFASIEEELIEQNNAYLEKMELGRQVYGGLIKGLTVEAALSKKNSRCPKRISEKSMYE